MSENSANMTEEFYGDDILERMEVTAKLKLPLLVLFGSMALAGIVFNAVTLYIFIVGKASSWKGVRYFVASLAASDVLFSLVSPAFTFFMLSNTSSPNSRVVCGLWRLAHESAFFVSLLNTLAIAIERFVVIYFPTVGLSSGRIPRLISIAVIWTVGIAVNFEYAIHTYPIQHPYYKVIMCYAQPRLFLIEKTAFLVLTNIRYFLPVSLILLFYALLAVKVHCRANIGANVTSTNKVTLKRRNQMVRTLLVDGLLTLFTYIPYKVYSLSMHVLTDLPPYMSLLTLYYIDMVLVTITMTNGFTTPIVYCCLNKDFKMDLFRLLPSRCTPASLRLNKRLSTSTTKTEMLSPI